MGGIRRFEDIRAWQLARKLVNSIYEVTNSGSFARDFGLRDQIRRAAGSIMHNIAEGFDSGTDAEFRRFLRISQRSALEVQSQLYTALDQRYLTQDQFNFLYQEAESIKAHVRKFASYLSGNDHHKIGESPADYRVDEPLDIVEDVGRWTLDENED
ncbi:MAG: four helix bundle protein [Anaerolineales bacterium]